MFLSGVKEGRLLAFCHHLICSRNRNDPHCHERSVFSSFEECQQILKHKVAGHVHYRTDNHQHKGESHPQRSRLSRLHRWFPQPEHIQPRTVDERKDDCTTRRSPAISGLRRLFRKAVTQTVLNLGPGEWIQPAPLLADAVLMR
jgi:hypothetical protein